jgi:hypothetical protein
LKKSRSTVSSTEAVGQPERERLRHDGARHAQLLHGAQLHFSAHLVIGKTRADQLVGAVLLGRVQLEETERREARDLHRADRDVALPARFGIEERVGDAERHLVAELGRAECVGIDQDVWHGADSN